MKSAFQLKKFAALTLSAQLFAVGCGQSDESDEAGTTPGTSASPTASIESTVSALAAAFPGTLALSVFPSETGSALRLTAEEAFDPNAKSFKDKVADQEKIANGTADSCLPDALGKQFNKAETENCYEFDQDMIYGANDSSGTSPRFLGSRDGKSSSGEACLVSFTRNQVSEVVAMIDQTLGFGMAAICQHKKLNKDAELPEIGKSVDLAAALKNLFGTKVTVTSATLERLEDKEELPVYRILIKVTIGADSIKRTIGIIHSPKDKDNKEYKGTMFTVMEGVPSFGLQNPPPGGQADADKYQHMSIVYERSETDGEKRVIAELRSAQVNKAIAADAITDAGILDLNVGTNVATGTLSDNTYGQYTGYQESNQAVSGITMVAFNIDPETAAGSLAYWKNPGGNYFENARGFNISIEADESTGALGGCATSGSASTDIGKGISIRRYLNDRESSLTLTPKGFYHPFLNTPTTSGSDDKGAFKTRTQQSNQVSKWYLPDLSDATLANTFITQQNGSLITRQCFKQDATSGLYLIDSTNTTEDAGYEILDTGNTVNAAKFVALPPPPEKPQFEGVKPQ
jgi:hypothetical protein